jgi:hypothetical protein
LHGNILEDFFRIQTIEIFATFLAFHPSKIPKAMIHFSLAQSSGE